MNEPRKHPDVFNSEEAREYLHIREGTDRTMETLRRSHGLVSFMIGQETMYHRRDLNTLVERLAGMDMKIRRPTKIGTIQLDSDSPASSTLRAERKMGRRG